MSNMGGGVFLENVQKPIKCVTFFFFKSLRSQSVGLVRLFTVIEFEISFKHS